MAWPEFVETFGGDCGEVALERWSTARGTIPGTFTYDAELVVAGRRRSFQVVDTGPIAALTAMLYETGRGVEILSFHQRAVADGTATFMHCERDGRRRWATAIADSTTDSALSALIVAANLLTNSNSATRAIWGKPAPPV